MVARAYDSKILYDNPNTFYNDSPFSRYSIAYDSQGKLYSSGSPRFENGFVEERLNTYFDMKGAFDAYLYIDLTDIADYVLQSGDYLKYDVFWPKQSLKPFIAVDLGYSDATYLREAGQLDQNGISSHPNADIFQYAGGQWYSRSIQIPAGHIGKTITKFLIACEQNVVGQYSAYFRDIRITDSVDTYVRKPIWMKGDPKPTTVVSLDTGGGQSGIVGRNNETRALLIEESITNLLSAVQSDFNTDSNSDGLSDGWAISVAGGDGARTRTLSRPTSFLAGGGNMQRDLITAVGNSNDEVLEITPRATVVAGRWYSVSAYVRTNVSGKVFVRVEFYDNVGGLLGGNINSATAINTNTVERLYASGGPSPAGAVTAAVSIRGIDAVNEWMEVENVQLVEQSSVVSLTSWQVGGTLREKDLFAIPSGGKIHASLGCVDFYVDINDSCKRQVAGQNPCLIDITRLSGVNLYRGILLAHNDSSALWTVATSNESDVITQGTIADSFTPNGWHHFRLLWDKTKLEVFIDGILRLTISDPKLPSAFGAIHFGSIIDTNYANTKFADIRLATFSRSTDELFSILNPVRPTPIDPKTTYKLDFQNGLEPQSYKPSYSFETSESSKFMISYLPPEYYESVFMKDYMVAIGIDLEMLRRWTQEYNQATLDSMLANTQLNELEGLLAQFIGKTATGDRLRLWEEQLDLPVDLSRTDNDRQDRILSALKAKLEIATPLFIKKLVETFGATGVDIVETIGSYSFDIKASLQTYTVERDIDIKAAVDKAKPAHLAYTVTYVGEAGWDDLGTKTWVDLGTKSWVTFFF